MGELKSLTLRFFLNCQVNMGSEPGQLVKHILMSKGEIQCFQFSFYSWILCELITPLPLLSQHCLQVLPSDIFPHSTEFVFLNQKSHQGRTKSLPWLTKCCLKWPLLTQRVWLQTSPRSTLHSPSPFCRDSGKLLVQAILLPSTSGSFLWLDYSSLPLFDQMNSILLHFILNVTSLEKKTCPDYP